MFRKSVLAPVFPTKRHQMLRVLFFGFMAIAACAIPFDACQGQFGGRQRGGRGRGPGGGGGGRGQSLIANEVVQQELKLTATQVSDIQEILDESRPDMSSFISRFRDASDEERVTLQTEMRELREKAGAETQKKIDTVLSGQQRSRLRGLNIQRSGGRALASGDVAESLKLNEEQRGKVAEMNLAYQGEMIQLGFRASDEDRQKVRDEFSTKMVSVLTAEQQKEFESQKGKPFDFDQLAQQRGGDRRDGRRDDERRGDDRPSPQSQAQSAPAAEPEKPMPAKPVDASEVVATFGNADTKGQDQKPEVFMFNFRQAPWAMVLEMFADGAGLTLDLNETPPGSFSHFDNKTYTATQALDIINGYLIRKGFILVKRDRFLIVVNLDKGVPPSLVPTVTIEQLKDKGDNELLNVVISLEGIEAEDAAAEVDALMGPEGSVVALTGSNTLSITDTGANLRRIHGLLKDSMAKGKPGELAFKQFVLKYISAVDAEAIIRSQFGLKQAVTNVSAGASGGGGRDPRFSRGSSPQPAPAPATTSTASNATQVTADLRTNSLLITATSEQLTLVEQILAAIDVVQGANGFAAAAGSNIPELRVYSVKSADATEVTKTLNAIMPGVVVNEDGRNGKIHIMATPREHDEVSTLR